MIQLLHLVCPIGFPEKESLKFGDEYKHFSEGCHSGSRRLHRGKIFAARVSFSERSMDGRDRMALNMLIASHFVWAEHEIHDNVLQAGEL
jgi:hypothetical protein